MKYIKLDSKDIYTNLAAEEYIFENYRDEDFFLLWQCDSCVVMGKYQNAFEEINLKEIENHEIKAARRNTGGGTVFHDKGNINYSFITDHNPERFSCYEDFLNPIIDALRNLGVNAEIKNHSDLVVEDKKISGNAQMVKRGRILHHGTLLYNADLSVLRNLLKPTNGDIESKSVKSRRSEVVNLDEKIDRVNFTIEDFKMHLIDYIATNYNAEELILSDEDINSIKELAECKYSTWDWNYGNSPKFVFKKDSCINNKVIRVELTVVKGKIAGAEINCGGNVTEEIKELLLREKLINQKYSYKTIEEAVQTVYGKEHSEIVTDCFF